jgi:translation initiation factor IF-2
MSKPASQLISRPPIVVIMGHIDHGKSTLLDYIRKSNVVATEAGGITQHISAYEVTPKTADGKESRLTFLDTPGHAAFQGMRSRGARVADIAILVVSAEDGVKAQTIEAYKAIKTANIPFIVAINKIDRPNANIDRTKQSLAEADIFVEGYGGDVPVAAISAKTGEGVPDLLDVLLLVAEMAELTADPSKPAEGVVIEAHMDPKKGVSATLIILDGTLEKGMFVVAEDTIAPVRIMENFLGKSIDTATFSSPIRITGWSSIPAVGASVASTSIKKDAEALLEANKESPGNARIEITQEEGVSIIPVVLKSDVLGTLEAIEHELGKLTHERVKLKIVQKSVGAVSESDIKHLVGAPGSPIVIGFHTKVDALATDLAERNGVTIKLFDIIYKLTEWLEEEMSIRAPKFAAVEELGELKVIRLFSHQKDRQVVGGRVEKGKITKHSKVKIMRRDAEVGEGQVVELQHQKLKADEVGEGEECGVSVESKITIAERDILVPFIVVQK